MEINLNLTGKKIQDVEILKYSTLFFESINNKDINFLNKLISSEDVQFWDYLNEEGYTGLIKSTHLDLTDISLLLISRVKTKFQLNPSYFKQYINHKGKNGFNALHYSSFRGNIKILDSLVNNGCDVNIKNDVGLNIMHMSAQGNQPAALVYLKDKLKMDIHVKDNVLSTPLHWACYMGADSICDYLISWNCDINEQDKDGFTPLHLAVLSERIKIVKKLIKVGADLNLKDKKNRKAVDIAIQRNNDSIKNILSNDVNLFSCNLNQHKADNSYYYPLVFFIYFFILEVILNFFVLPHLNSVYKYQFSVILMLGIFLFYLKLYFSNPGVKKKITNKTLISLVSDGEIMTQVCPYCITQISSTTKHCLYCNLCVESLDHHCVWIRNCIGKKNFTDFMIFLILICFKLLVNVYFSIEAFFVKINSLNNFHSNHFFMENFTFLYSSKIKTISASIVLIFGMLVFLPVLYLTVTHFQNLQKGRAKYNKNLDNNYNEENNSLLNILK